MPVGTKKEQGYSLTLENVDRHAEGTYVCTASNGIGNPASHALKVLVEYPPEINTEKAIIRTGEGDVAELVCTVHARPMATVTWTRDGQEIKADPNVKEINGGHKHALTIADVTEEKFGSYQCTAKNNLGEETAEINLTGKKNINFY